jgi:uncharacterized protein HemX
MKKVEEILKRSALSQYQNKFLVDVKDMNWLVEQSKKAEKQHFEILALEANLNGNGKIIEEQQKKIEKLEGRLTLLEMSL